MSASDWVFRPEDFLGYIRRVRGLRASQMRIPPRAILVFGGNDWQAVRRALGARTVSWHRWLALGRAGQRAVGVLRTTIGAPAAATALEEAAALGAREVVAFGACGSLTRDLRIGGYVIPTFAVSDEGTSKHYGGGPTARPDSGLVEALATACERSSLPFRRGGVWTTDAPYRESRERARTLRKRGVLGVEMEASAVYNVAHAIGVRAASLCVVSDELEAEEWTPAFSSPVFRRAKRRAIPVLLAVLSRPPR